MNRNLAFKLTGVAFVLALGACGGGGSSGGGVAGTAGSGGSSTDTAGSGGSTDSFFTAASALLSASENSEPVELDNFNATAPENTEPTSLDS